MKNHNEPILIPKRSRTILDYSSIVKANQNKKRKKKQIDKDSNVKNIPINQKFILKKDAKEDATFILFDKKKAPNKIIGNEKKKKDFINNTFSFKRESRIPSIQSNYESYLQLDNNNVPRCASKEQINSLKTLFYQADSQDPNNCPICCEEYEEKVEICMMPCDHQFHKECISLW